MNKEQLEYYLNRGSSFGFNTKKNEKIIGWVLISKRFPINKFFERFTKEDNPEVFHEQVRVELEPYNVAVAELKREAFDSNSYPISDDYILNETYSFRTLDDLEFFLRKLNLEISQMKWTSEIDFF